MAQTIIGEVRSRTDIPAFGQTADGKERALLNLVPNRAFDNERMFGSYKYCRVPIYSGATRKVHVWHHFDRFSKQWEEVQPRDGNLCIPGELEWGLMLIAHDFGCDVWINFDVEYLDPERPEDHVTVIKLHLFGLEGVRDRNGFVQAVASRIHREAKRYALESVNWTYECI